MTEQLEKEYDVFLVHSSVDQELAIKIKEALKSRGMKIFAHFDQGTTFGIGQPVVTSIMEAVKISRIVLILLTENALKSHWVSYEILLSLEKSQREGCMCCRLCMVGISEAERARFQTGELKLIPHVIIDINNPKWPEELEGTVKADVCMTKILPSGNVAVGLVFNYFAGFLRQILPGLKRTVEESQFYQESGGKMLPKLIILLPSSCVVPQICGGGSGGVPEIKKEGSLSIEAAHGDKTRKYNPTVYSIDMEGEKWYFPGECPTIIETMSKLKKCGFVDIDIRLQVERFSITLQELVQHRNNEVCNNTVSFIVYDDEKQKTQEVISEKLLEEKMCLLAMSTKQKAEVVRHVAAQKEQDAKKEQRLKRPWGNTDEGLRPDSPADDSEQPQTKKRRMQKTYFASITTADTERDRQVANDLMKFLSEKDRKITAYTNMRVTGVLENSRWNIFIFSKDALCDPLFKRQYQDAIHASIDDNQLQVIPILSKGVKLDDIPSQYKWITLHMSDDADYIQKLWDFMESEPPTMTELIPAGEVYKGLAWAYLLNYLPVALLGKTEQHRGFRERFQDAMIKYNIRCPCIARVFIIIPASCSFPKPGTQFEGEDHIGPLEPVVDGFRKYFLQFYRVTLKDGRQYCYAREYATPVIAMYEMAHTYKFAGLSIENLYSQTKLFTQYVSKNINTDKFKSEIGDLQSRLWLVNYDDQTEVTGRRRMVDALEKEIDVCLQKGEQLITPAMQ